MYLHVQLVITLLLFSIPNSVYICAKLVQTFSATLVQSINFNPKIYLYGRCWLTYESVLLVILLNKHVGPKFFVETTVSNLRIDAGF